VVEVSGPFVLPAQGVTVCKLTNPNPGVECVRYATSDKKNTAKVIIQENKIQSLITYDTSVTRA